MCLVGIEKLLITQMELQTTPESMSQDILVSQVTAPKPLKPQEKHDQEYEDVRFDEELTHVLEQLLCRWFESQV